MEVGQPTGEPGAAFHYSHPGYILLGEILERIAGAPMSQAVPGPLDLETLGLGDAWFESLGPPPAGAPPRVHRYIGPFDATDTTLPSTSSAGAGWSRACWTWRDSAAHSCMARCSRSRRAWRR